MPGVGPASLIIPVSGIVRPNKEKFNWRDPIYASFIAGSKIRPAICGRYASPQVYELLAA